ncbi:MAG: GGDEF domain-containing protein [Pseudobutyrivibrio sp.]|nr:GGDEF domain-containing protein [Pseudobutyrivibrio sp.]
MDWGLFRRVVAFAYAFTIFIFIGLGFSYSNEMGSDYCENTIIYNKGWKIDDRIITFPYGDDEVFTISNELPLVFGDQLLIIRAYYEDFEAEIDGKIIGEDRVNTLFGNETLIGNKEIWIPLQREYTGKTINIKIKMQKSLYGAEITDALITTRSAYAVASLKANIPSLILFIFLSVSGIIELCISSYFILKHTTVLRKLSFEALFYAGIFSIISAQWIINETRIPFIAFGHIVGFSVLTVVSFLLMPLMFLELSRAMFYRVSKVDNTIDFILAMTVLISISLCVQGTIDWGDLVYVAHALDFIVMILVGYYSGVRIKNEKEITTKTIIAIGNGLFIVIAGIGLIHYIININSNYTLIIILDLLMYISIQIGLIYRRIGLKVKEEKEFELAKIYAFTDELTGLTNRRFFYNKMEEYEKRELPGDLIIIEIDVNRLKFYNDNMGHEAGDELLKGTADCMRRAFGNCRDATISRMGGDEFSISLLTTKADLERRIIDFRNYLYNWNGKYINGISVALGYATVRENPGLSINDISKIADENMYEDKRLFYENSEFERRGYR